MLSAALLGLVQGLTEFLPVSSSGHLVLFQQFLEAPQEDLLFDLILHLGTLVPVVLVFRRDLVDMATAPFRERGPLPQRPATRLLGLLILASIPTAIIGLVFQDQFEALFSTPSTLVLTFAMTGALLFGTRALAAGQIGVPQMTPAMALAIGTVQGLAIAPGISRSGSTIAVALFLGLNRDLAGRFSFLLSIPAILGAFLLKANEVELGSLDIPPLMVGGLVAATAGYLALKLLLRTVRTGDFSRFCWYCWSVAILALVLALTGA